MRTNSALAVALRNRRQDSDNLLNDGFAGTFAAGAVNGSWSADGRGIRGVIDGNSKLSIGSGALSAATGGVGNFDPSLVYADTFARTHGMLLIANVTLAGGRVQFGWGAGTGLVAATINSNRRGVFDFNSTTLAIAPTTTGSITVGALVLATAYTCAVVQRNAGMIYLIKGGAFTNWTLLYIDAVGTSPLLNPFVSALGTTGVFTVESLRVPRLRYLPAPVVSDGFSAWGSSDGLGHAEGIAGGLGSGGHGLAWTSNVGTWAASGGVAAASALSGGRAIATVDAGKADLIISANMVVPSGTLSIVVRWTDESNFVMLRRTPTNLQLVKVVAGVSTTVSDNASTYVAGAEVRLVCEGTKFRMFYNNAVVSTEQTIADAAVQSATVVGLRSGDTTCTADNFVAYARGTGGEHSALDAF